MPVVVHDGLDGRLAPEIEAAYELVVSGAVVSAAEDAIGALD